MPLSHSWCASPIPLLYSSSFFQVSDFSSSSTAPNTPQLLLSNHLHTWISNSLTCARTLGSFQDHLSHILQGFCICEIIAPGHGISHQNLTFSTLFLVSNVSSTVWGTSFHLLFLLQQTHLTAQFLFLSFFLSSSTLAPRTMCTSSLGPEREEMMVNLPFWSQYPISQLYLLLGAAFPWFLNSLLCYFDTFIPLGPAWAVSYSSFPHLRNICLDKPQRPKGYEQAEALWLGPATPLYFVGTNCHWARSIQLEKVIHTSAAHRFTHAPDVSWYTRADSAHQLLFWAGAWSSEGWQMVSQLGQEASLLCDVSPVLYKAQHIVDAASSLPGPGTRIQILLLNWSPHRNTTK